jgi:hypothetical protein
VSERPFSLKPPILTPELAIECLINMKCRNPYAPDPVRLKDNVVKRRRGEEKGQMRVQRFF